MDHAHEGAAKTRNRGIELASAHWIALIDSDDEWMAVHLERLLDVAERTGADIVYPGYVVANGTDPLFVTIDGEKVSPFGLEWSPDHEKTLRESNNFIPVTVLARRELLLDVGGFKPFPWADPNNPCEDWSTWCACLDAGAKFVHAPVRSWIWNHHGSGNTGGAAW
jgi:glycosyltransferase involved in cell wall biosynthesis